MGGILTDIVGEELQDKELLTNDLNNLNTTDTEYEDCQDGEREKDSDHEDEDQTIQPNINEDVGRNSLNRAGTDLFESEGLYRHMCR